MRLANLFFLVVYFLLLLVIFVLPVFSVPEYSSTQHTLSQLGAQGAPNAWIVSALLVYLGGISIVAGWQHFSNFWVHQALLIPFGASLILMAFFQHAPIDTALAYNLRDHELHVLFTIVAGCCFTLLAISTGWFMDKKRDTIIAYLTAGVALFFALLMYIFPEMAGLCQRMVFIIAFGWLLYEFYRAPVMDGIVMMNY